jgi:hypothetical protein
VTSVIKKIYIEIPQIINSIELLDMELRRLSKLFKKYSKFSDGDLYMFTVAIIQCGKYNLITQASKVFFLTKTNCTHLH